MSHFQAPIGIRLLMIPSRHPISYPDGALLNRFQSIPHFRTERRCSANTIRRPESSTRLNPWAASYLVDKSASLQQAGCFSNLTAASHTQTFLPVHVHLSPQISFEEDDDDVCLTSEVHKHQAKSTTSSPNVAYGVGITKSRFQRSHLQASADGEGEIRSNDVLA